MEYQAYLFDFDYTLANSELGIVSCFQYVLQMYHYLDISDEAIKRTIGMTLKDAFRELTKTEDENLIQEYKKVYKKKADEIMNKNTKLFPSVPELLKTLSENKKKIIVVSTKSKDRIEEFFQITKLENYIDFIIGGEDVKKEKPNPEGIFKAMEKFRLEKREVLYVGDSIIDAKTAQAAEVDFIGVTSGVTTKQELEVFPHLSIIEDIKDILQIERDIKKE